MAMEFIRNLNGSELDAIQIADAVEDYLLINPVSAAEPLLVAHLADATPHPTYDVVASGRFVTYLRNGLA